MKKMLIILFVLSSILVAQKNESDFLTKFEKSDYLETDRYQESMEYFSKLADESEFAEFITFGVSPQGRDLKILIANKNSEFDLDKIKNSEKAIVLIQSGIHAGEICGKDASMILMREILITKEKEAYLDSLIILVIPIFNVDGHERFGKYNRLNQNGPKEMGYRVTAQNLNLNRDYMKADSPEMQALLKLYTKVLPDFYIDIHSTDGADYQYHITYNTQKFPNFYKPTVEWIKSDFIPSIESYVNENGYLISPFVSYVQGDFKKGIRDWIASPRFSNGYTVLQNRPSLLIETHVLKPYKERVFSAKYLTEGILLNLSKNRSLVKKLNKDADLFALENFGAKRNPYPNQLKLSQNSTQYNYKGIEPVMSESPIMGTQFKTYRAEKVSVNVPYYDLGYIISSFNVPAGYLVPKEWGNIVERLTLHGVDVDTVQEPTDLEIKEYELDSVKFASRSYEGRIRCDFQVYSRTKNYEAQPGDYIIRTNQRAVGVIVNLLEPEGDDSFAKWGFFNSIFERKEYFEPYVMEPIARIMMQDNPELAKEFNEKLKNEPEFKNDPYARLFFWYERSPYYDSKYKIYPVKRLLN
ncbi:MAG: M14 family metallopeptidase [Melioribacteraceae bacterium]|nr:M14 family metallopeptidase [Melioribacteraceae bacterium]MCF8265911.1 M14 family metallopeptidase [Melioribacteraceae bacterium]